MLNGNLEIQIIVSRRDEKNIFTPKNNFLFAQNRIIRRKQDLYLVQLIEHPILRIPNILFVYFWVLFPDKSFKLLSKYTQKCQYISLY